MGRPLARRYSKMSQPERRALRLEYVRWQGGKCLHCGQPLDGDPPAEVRGVKVRWSLFPPNFLRHPVHLHHSHRTDKTIGAVHALCNAVLWQEFGE